MDRPPTPIKRNRKTKIPKALREAVWIERVGRKFEHKCLVPWCPNTMTVFDFQTGHNVPESRGGATTLENLVPICSRCNLSMSNTYTIKEWSEKFGHSKTSPERSRNPFLTMFLYLRNLMRRKSTTIRPAPAVAPSRSPRPSRPALYRFLGFRAS